MAGRPPPSAAAQDYRIPGKRSSQPRAFGGHCQQSPRGREKMGLPRELQRLRKILERGLQETAELWPAIQAAYRWIHQAAHLLKIDGNLNGRTLPCRLRGLLGTMARHRAKAGRWTGFWPRSPSSPVA